MSDRIDDLNFACSTCEMCSLHRNRKVSIQGVGSLNPDIVLVVDRTSVKSSLSGDLFAGSEGSVLNYLIRWSGLDPASLYVTPSVACPTESSAPQRRPKEVFGAPKKASVKACRSRLHEEIRILDPNIIVAMGPTAVDALRGSSNFTQSKGRVVEGDIIGEEADYKLPVMVLDSVMTLLRTAQNPGKIWNKNLAYIRWASTINKQLKEAQ